MTEFLLRLGMMSLQATVIVFVVLVLRFIFSKLHIAKKYTILLWVIPYIAMILPWEVKTPFSFWQLTQEGQTKIEQAVNTMPYSTDRLVQVTIDADTLKEMEENRQAPPSLENIQSPSGTKTESKNETVTYYATEKIEGYDGFFSNLSIWDVFIYSAFSVWLLGLCVYMTCGIISSLKLKKKLICSLCLRENVYVADEIKEPFVFGIFSPKIYLPCNLTTDNEYYVVEHEKTHIYRKDSIKKLMAFLITGIHWFNPFSYVAFHMMTKDMEMACDEETIQRIGVEKRKDYASALLKLSTKKKNLLIPVAFGEGNVKSRIKNILKYKKTIKALAVLAAIVMVILAVVFLTKPMEKTVEFGNMRNYDVVKIPKADTPKAITVTYQGETYSFDESFYDEFRIFIENLLVYEEEVSKSRSENRPADIVISLEGKVFYNFDENMETIWCDNRVKPSMTYEIVEPKLAIQFLAAQIGTKKKESSGGEVQISSKDEVVTSFLDDAIQLTAKLVTEDDLCGHNGPFLDYADERYVVFHTNRWFYVYDMLQEEIIKSVGSNDIQDVKVSVSGKKAYIYDKLDLKNEPVYIFECDLLDKNKWLTSIFEEPTIDDFSDFSVTKECVLPDSTVFRTTECIQLIGKGYLYLESGSGLLEDLCLVVEDEEGNRIIKKMFSSFIYKGEKKIVQELVDEYIYMESIDLTHDGKDEYLIIDVTEMQRDNQKSAHMEVYDSEGNILWQTELGLPRAGWNSYFRVETGDGTYLMEYLPVLMQERGEYSYRVFYLDAEGNEIEVNKNEISFLVQPNNIDIDAQIAMPKEKMLEFADEVNGYFQYARALISTVNGVLRYQTPSRTYIYVERYAGALELAEVSVSESISLNITKLQNYYELLRKDMLKKQGVILLEDEDSEVKVED